MTKVVLSPIASDYKSVALINSNYDTIEEAFDNTLSRDGTTPNQMDADIDMNGHQFLNLVDPTNNQNAATKNYVDTVGTSILSQANAAKDSAANSAAAAQYYAGIAQAGASSLPIGGTTGQVLTKLSNTSGDADWQTPSTYTDEQVRDVMGATLVAGANVTITVDDPGNTITIASTGGGGGSGDVVGPSSATDNHIARFDGTTGKLIQNSSASVDDSGNISATNFSGSSSGSNTGDQTITLTGDVTGSGTGSFAATIGNTKVTLAKIANAAANSKLLGSGASGSGASYAELTLGTNLSMSGTTLNAATAAALHPGYITGRIYSLDRGGGSGTGLLAGSATITYVCPIYIGSSLTIDKLYCQTTTTGGNVEMAVYANSSGQPGSRLFQGGSISNAASGLKTTTGVALAVTQGWYWFAVQTSSTPNLVSWATNTFFTALLGAPTDLTDRSVNMSLTSTTFGTWPDPFGSPTYGTGNVPILGFSV